MKFKFKFKMDQISSFQKMVCLQRHENGSKFTLLWMKKINIYVKMLLLCCCRCIQIKLLGHYPQNCYLLCVVTLLHIEYDKSANEGRIGMQFCLLVEVHLQCSWVSSYQAYWIMGHPSYVVLGGDQVMMQVNYLISISQA